MRRYFLIFDLGDLGFTVKKEKSQVGLILSISWFYLLKQREGRRKGLSFKKSRFGTFVWNSCMDYLYGNYHKPYLFMGC